ncbi:MAG: hypothetical protein QNJ69_11115 [Gammaproteobacteria bacterium]|nr:hypothetical protein [Gammaproteobacteria bacterium]
MSHNSNQAYSIWLLPETHSADVIESIIGKLSHRFDTPTYTAHATLCSGSWAGELSSLLAAVDAIARQSSPLTTTTSGIRYIDRRFQFFFLSLVTDNFLAVQNLAQDSLPGSRLPEVGPHLSLIYSDNFAGVDRAQLRAEWQSQMPDTAGFDRLALVLPSDNGWDDIAGWKIEHRTKLAG